MNHTTTKDNHATPAAENSPLPWRVHEFPSVFDNTILALNNVGKHPMGRNWGAYVETADSTSIAQTDGTTEGEAIANARLIVCAVNEREGLIAALRELLDCETNLAGCSGVKLLDAVDTARAVLERVEGKQ